MADGDTDTGERETSAPGSSSSAPPAAGGKKPGKLKALINGPHRDEILVVTGTIGVILAYLTFKKAGAPAGGTAAGGATQSTSTLAPTTGALAGTSGQVAGYNQSNPAASAGFASYLQNLTQEVAALQAGANAQTNPTTPTSTPAAFRPQGFVYDQNTATYGAVDNSGGVNWLTNLQAGIYGANQQDATPIANAGRGSDLYTPPLTPGTPPTH